MAKEHGDWAPQATSDPGLKRRGLLQFGTVMAALTGASALTAVGTESAQAATDATTYATLAEVNSVSTLATVAAVEAARKGLLIEPMKDTSGLAVTGNGSVVVATDDVAVPNRYVVTTKAAGESVRFAREYSFSIPKGGAISVPVKRDANLDRIEFELGVGSYSASKTLTFSLQMTARTFPGQWFNLVVPVAVATVNPSGAMQADAATCTFLRIRSVPVAGTTTVAEYGPVRIVGGVDTTPRVVFQFDDGRLDTYTAAYPILKANGYRGTVAIEYQTVGTTGVTSGPNNGARMNLTQLQALYADGWEYIGHHHLQVPANYTLGSAAILFKEWKDWARTNGFSRGTSHWVWPGGAKDSAYDAVAARYFATRRGVHSASQYATRYVCNPQDISHVYVSAAGSTALYKGYIDRCVEFGGTLVFAFHSIVDGTATAEDYPLAGFTEIVQYARAKGLIGSSYDETFGTLGPSIPAR